MENILKNRNKAMAGLNITVLGDAASQHYLSSQIDNKRSVIGQLLSNNHLSTDPTVQLKALDTSGR
jgi:hypothetical protein